MMNERDPSCTGYSNCYGGFHQVIFYFVKDVRYEMWKANSLLHEIVNSLRYELWKVISLSCEISLSMKSEFIIIRNSE